MIKKMQVIGSRVRLMVQVGVAGMIMVVLFGVSGSPSASKSFVRPRPRPPLDEGATRRVEALYAGVPQHGAELGRPGAQVTLQFFGDLECPEARQFVLGALPFLIRKWVRSGDLRIVYRASPAETIWHDIFRRQQAAALAAGEQGMLWQYLDFFYHSQGPEFTRYATEHFLAAIANEVPGLNRGRWRKDRRGPELTHRVMDDLHLAGRHGIDETPAFMIGPTGGAARHLWHFSLTEPAAFDEAIEDVLASSTRS